MILPNIMVFFLLTSSSIQLGFRSTGAFGFITRRCCSPYSSLSRTTFQQQQQEQQYVRPFTTITTILKNSGYDDNNKSNTNNFSISLSVPTMETMEEIGALISIVSKPTDVILLDGDLGAGKTTFSRGFIHCKLGLFDFDETDDESDDEEDNEESEDKKQQKQQQQQSKNNNDNIIRVTSPTYLLSNTYVYKDDNDDQNDDQRIRE